MFQSEKRKHEETPQKDDQKKNKKPAASTPQ